MVDNWVMIWLEDLMQQLQTWIDGNQTAVNVCAATLIIVPVLAIVLLVAADLRARRHREDLARSWKAYTEATKPDQESF